MSSLFTKINRHAWILMAFFFAFGVMTISCSDDDDDNGSPNEQNDNNNPGNAEEGSYNISIEGDISTEMSDGQAFYTKDALGDAPQYDSTEDATMVIILADTSTQHPQQITIAVYKPNTNLVDAGTYDLVLQNEADLKTGSTIYLSSSGSTYIPPTDENNIKGNVELTSVTDTDAKGQLNDVYLRSGFDTTSTVTLNGAFHAKRVN